MKDLYRIISGKTIVNLSGLTLVVRPFSVDDMYFAESVGNEVYQNMFENGCYTTYEILEISKYYEIWSDDKESLIEQIPKDIDQMKLDYYNAFTSLKFKEYIKNNIEKKYDQLLKLYKEKNDLLLSTCETGQSLAKKFTLLERCTYHNDSLYNFTHITLPTLVKKYESIVCDDFKIRDISKSSAWRNIWISNDRNGNSIFENNILNYEQQTLMSWTRLYDSVYESSECPPDEILDDDLALDGWLVLRRRKREEETRKQHNDGKFKNKHAGEVMIPVKNAQEAASVMSLNDQRAQRKIAMLQNDLDKHKEINEFNLSSVQEEIAIFLNNRKAQK